MANIIAPGNGSTYVPVDTLIGLNLVFVAMNDKNNTNMEDIYSLRGTSHEFRTGTFLGGTNNLDQNVGDVLAIDPAIVLKYSHK